MNNKGKSSAPLANLFDIAANGRRINAPAADLDDLVNLDQYMPYESLARELDRDKVCG
jgi:hypothetical protein